MLNAMGGPSGDHAGFEALWSFRVTCMSEPAPSPSMMRTQIWVRAPSGQSSRAVGSASMVPQPRKAIRSPVGDQTASDPWVSVRFLVPSVFTIQMAVFRESVILSVNVRL